MEIILNNRKESFAQKQLTISEILKIKNFTFPRLVIKINNELIKKDQYDSATVRDGDKLDIIHLISGG